MNELIEKCAQSSDEDLSKELRFVAERERRNLAAALIALGEYGYRRLYREQGYYSLFEYCLRVLKYDESAAYRHITAARVVRQYPDALPLVASGELTLTSLLILSPVLTSENRTQMFQNSRGKSRRELETIVAGLCPLPPRMDFVRTVPVPPPSWGSLDSVPPSSAAEQPASAAGIIPSAPPREWQAVMPLSLERVRIGFDAAISMTRLVDRAKQVLRHKYPQGRLEDIFHEALRLLLDRKDPQRRLELKNAAPPRARAAGEPKSRLPRAIKAGRYVPARVKEAVWQRDDGRCAWRFDDGTVCGSRDWIEYDHVRPFAKGGRSDSARNIRLLCRLHNGLAAAAVFGTASRPKACGEGAAGRSAGATARGASDDRECNGGRATPCARSRCG